jgi:hypothetical protein
VRIPSSRRVVTAGLAAAAVLALAFSQTGTARAAAHAAETPTIVFNSPPDTVTARHPATVEVEVTNPGTTDIDNVRFDFDIIGFTVLTPADLTVTYPAVGGEPAGMLALSQGSTNADVVGSYPDSAGFTLAAGADDVIDFTVAENSSNLRGPFFFVGDVDAVGGQDNPLAEADGPLLTVPRPTPYDVQQHIVLGRSSSSTEYYTTADTNGGGTPLAVLWGRSTDVRLAADPLGTGDDFPVLYRPSTATFYAADEDVQTGPNSVSVPSDSFSSSATPYGRVGDVPLLGNFDPDPTTQGGFDEFAVYRPSTETFYVQDGNSAGTRFGRSGDIPVVGNWTGTTAGDSIGVFRPSNHTFYLLTSSGTVLTESLGRTGDTPVVGDWNGGVATLIGIHRGNTFYLAGNTAGGALTSFAAGQSTDTATAAYDVTPSDLLALADNATVASSARMARERVTVARAAAARR